jgi:hypothetical protein
MNLPGASASIFDRNKFLAEDRILAFGQSPRPGRVSSELMIQKSLPRNKRNGDCNMLNLLKQGPMFRGLYPNSSLSEDDGLTGRYSSFFPCPIYFFPLRFKE